MKKWMSLLLVVFFCLVLCGCGKEEPQESVAPSEDDDYETVEPSPEPTPEPVYVKIGTVRNVSSFLNIRSGPGTAYDVLGKAHQGDRFLILSEYYSENWHQVEYEGGIAYIHADYLLITEEFQTEETEGSSGGSADNDDQSDTNDSPGDI